MDEVEAKKQERSKSKMAVTRTSRRLIDATHRDVDFETLKGFIMELEKVYDDFCVITEEYELLVSDEKFAEHRVVNGEDLVTYNANVRQTYVDARDVYVKIKAENDKSKQNLAMVPLVTALRRDMNRLQDIISAVDDSLSQEAPSSESLQMDRSDMETLLNEMCDKIDKLTVIRPDTYLLNDVETLMGTAYNKMRKVNLHLKRNQAPKVHVIVSKDDKGPTNTEGMSISLTTPVTSEVQTLVTGPTSEPAGPTPSNILPNSPEAGMQSVKAAHSVGSIMSNTPISSNNYTFVSPQNPPVAQMSSSTFVSPQNPAVGQMSSSTLISPQNPTVGQMSSSTFVSASHHYGSVRTTPEVTNPSYSLPSNPRSELNPPPQNWVPGTHPWYYNTTSNSSLVPSYATTIAPPNQSRQTHPTGSPLINNANISLKKTSLPTFSGLRKDWPEFKAVWKQLAESVYSNKTALAHELKRSVKGEASQRIRSVYITRPEAYDTMWKKLEAHYDDASASAQAALAGLQRLKPVESEDYRALMELVDDVEAAYCQLQELNHLDILTMRDVDHISKFLPSHVRVEWIRKYQDMSAVEKVNPFPHFMKFIEREREAVARLAESQPAKKRSPFFDKSRVKGQLHQISAGSRGGRFYKCAFPAHRKDNINHKTSDCNEFRKLEVSGKQGRYELLKQINACFKCFGNHKRQDCPNTDPCSSCGSKSHHQLLCKSKKPPTIPPEQPDAKEVKREEKESNVVQSDTLALYPIYQATVVESGKSVSVFCDGGSNSSYITHRAADKIGAKVIRKLTLDVTTMGDVEKTYSTREYQFTMRTRTGRKVTVNAFGMERITGPVSKLNPDVLAKLFPDHDPESLQRKSEHIDVLLGCDYFGLHPKNEEARCGANLSIMSGELGICLQGTHPDLSEETYHDTNLAKTIHDVRHKAETYSACFGTHPEFTRQRLSPQNMEENTEAHHSMCNITKLKVDRGVDSQIENFIRGEELGTETSPRCGGCRCNKCPSVGHTYSFKEEQELKMIQDNLEYDEQKRCWRTSYPWLIDPSSLPDNYSAALATLRNTERTLSRDSKWAETYKVQMKDMEDRQVARKLTPQELKEWKGPVFYIAHLAVVNPRSNSTPVRIVFNSSQSYRGVSLNSCLAKGPDAYINNLIGILLRWREEYVAFVGDLKKMFNSVHLKSLEQHCHRFLWRDMDTEREPDVYVMERVNMGDSPAPAISTEAVYKTANLFQEESPEAAVMLKKSSYVDDLIDSRPNKQDALKLAYETENMLAKGGFTVKCWQFSGEEKTRSGEELQQSVALEKKSNDFERPLLKGTDENLRILGVGWKPKEDVIVFDVTLNFSQKRRGIRSGPNLMLNDLPEALPDILTKRIVLQQVMKIYDPLGLISPFTLIGKIYLRETWSRNLGWDDQLPADLRTKWVKFFVSLFELEKLNLQRCLRPPEAVGNPWLVMLSDGSDIAYGFVAYIRWVLVNGNVWCRLIMAKCRVAPVNKLSTPQMELNAAVLSKRGRKIIEQEMRFQFERVLQIVDSETVLNMINKTSTRFKVYEGVRLGEIQAATDGDMGCWAWISGKDNTADWLTRGRSPGEINEESEWWNGPSILYQPIEEWGLKFGSQKEECLPGEKRIHSATTAAANPPLLNYERFSDINRAIWVVARILAMLQNKSFRGGKTMLVSVQLLRDAENFIVRDVQKTMREELVKTDHKGRKGGRYATLSPVYSESGLCLVGERLKQCNPMTLDSSPQKLLPSSHRVTRLLMQRAHQCGHRGRDATLAKFREKYWVPQGSKLARKVTQNCQLCKLRQAKLLQQVMGQLPEERLQPSPPFTHVMLDMFGPYVVKGEVQKRVSGKAYGVIFTDLVIGAVHIEAVYGYDTQSFLMALSRFACIHGWPATIYSDPGSQLVGADRELKEAWKSIDREALHTNGVQNGLTWLFGPADSPWNQGKVEALVKAAKRAIHFAVHNKRLAVSEFLTVCYEVANLLNERPIGTLPGADSSLNILTPNTLLLGRACAKNPGNWQPAREHITKRYHFVQAVVSEFWAKWIELCAPALVTRYKWTKPSRNLRPGDIVLIADKSPIKGDYRLGMINEVFAGKDGKVRRVLVKYKNYKVGKRNHEYTGCEEVIVSRSVHRLALLVPVENDEEKPDED